MVQSATTIIRRQGVSSGEVDAAVNHRYSGLTPYKLLRFDLRVYSARSTSTNGWSASAQNDSHFSDFVSHFRRSLIISLYRKPRQSALRTSSALEPAAAVLRSISFTERRTERLKDLSCQSDGSCIVTLRITFQSITHRSCSRSSTSESRKPFANGLLAIFNCVICMYIRNMPLFQETQPETSSSAVAV